QIQQVFGLEGLAGLSEMGELVSEDPEFVVVADVAVAQGMRTQRVHGGGKIDRIERPEFGEVDVADLGAESRLTSEQEQIRADGAYLRLQRELVRLLDHGAHRLELGLVSFEIFRPLLRPIDAVIEYGVEIRPDRDQGRPGREIKPEGRFVQTLRRRKI